MLEFPKIWGPAYKPQMVSYCEDTHKKDPPIYGKQPCPTEPCSKVTGTDGRIAGDDAGLQKGAKHRAENGQGCSPLLSY